MRFAVVMAGTAGFVLVLGVSLLLEKAADRSLIHATMAAVVFAVLGHWWLKLWTSGLEQAQLERAQAEAAAAATAEETAAAAATKPAGAK